MFKKIIKQGLILSSFLIVLASCCHAQISPNETSAGPKLINLNEEVTLKKDESAKLNDTGVSLKITGFINSPCPEGAQCIWSGVGVNYELTIDDRSYKGLLQKGQSVLIASLDPVIENLPYEIKLIDSDYETFAVVRIVKTP